MFPSLKLLILGLVSLLCCPVSFCEYKLWLEVRSQHFRVITNGSEGAARRVSREFEQMRAVFANQFPGYLLDSGAPLLILAPVDENTTKQLMPEFWQHSGPKPAGFYEHGWDKQYAMVRLDFVSDRFNPDAYSVVYHEYVHSLLHLNLRWLPTWLDEGLAQFYGFTRFEKHQIFIGAPPKNMAIIGTLDRALIPLDEFIGYKSSFFRDEDKTHMFYAQAWALTHYLIFGPGMEQGERLKRFFNSLQRGIEQKKAFEETFGSFKEVEKGLRLSLLKFAFITGVIPSPPQTDEATFSARRMSLAETEAEIGAFQIWTKRWKEARESVEAAGKHDPKLGLAHEDIGFVDFNEGQTEEAARQFSEALDLDNKLYLSLFAKTMISPIAQSQDPTGQELFRQELLKVIDLNPNFAPAYVQLAKLYVVQGQLSKALDSARKAERLEPARAGYHLLSGQILLRMGHPAEAAASALYVADRWSGPDHDEAMELWNSIPVEQRHAETPLADTGDDAAKIAEGVVKSVSCVDRSFVITLERARESLTFHSQGFPVGFSDTLWTGRDHFTPCFHVNGLRAVVKYKAVPDGSYTGDLLNVGFRDALPPAPKAATTADIR